MDGVLAWFIPSNYKHTYMYRHMYFSCYSKPNWVPQPSGNQSPGYSCPQLPVKVWMGGEEERIWRMCNSFCGAPCDNKLFCWSCPRGRGTWRASSRSRRRAWCKHNRPFLSAKGFFQQMFLSCFCQPRPGPWPRHVRKRRRPQKMR